MSPSLSTQRKLGITKRRSQPAIPSTRFRPVLTLLLFAAVCFVAFTNGANANFKGVASLYGSGTTSRRMALAWGTATTFAGSLSAMFLAGGMLQKFSGRGIVSDSLARSPDFLTAVAIGAALTSFLATRFGFPVSTTHALVGALTGAGLVGDWLSGSTLAAAGFTEAGTADASALSSAVLDAGRAEGVRFSALGKQFLYPLFLSPLVAVVLGAASYAALRWLRWAPDQRSKPLDTFHFFSTGAASFARGLNDTPKMAALLSVSPGVEMHWAFLAVAAAILLGGWLDAENVAETLGKKVTGMNPGQGFAASLVTAGLVTTASLHSWPVSTTHVSVGALTGMGASTRQARWRKVAEILLAWVSTVPCAAILAGLALWLLRCLGTPT
ncbi:MAG: anion permease [Planctomycetota bacterium]